MEQTYVILIVIIVVGVYFIVRSKQKADAEAFQRNIEALVKTGSQFKCPKCGSNQLHSSTKGWNWKTGLRGSGQIIITCSNCGDKWEPVIKQ